MKKFLFLFLVFAGFSSHAQELPATLEFLFTGSHWSLSAIFNRTQSATVEHRSGEQWIGTSPAWSMEGGVKYHYNYNEFYSLLMGIHVGASRRNYAIFIPRERFTPVAAQDHIEGNRLNSYEDIYFNVPVFLERRWKQREKGYWNLQAGIHVNFHPLGFGETIIHKKEDPAGGYYDLMRMELEVGGYSSPWLTYGAGAGYSWLLANHHMLRANVVVHHSNKSITRGTYSVTVPGQPLSEGNYASRHSYVGVSVGYLVTGANKRMRKVGSK